MGDVILERRLTGLTRVLVRCRTCAGPDLPTQLEPVERHAERLVASWRHLAAPVPSLFPLFAGPEGGPGPREREPGEEG